MSNRYDALGRRVSRTLNGNKTDYVLDVSGGMERILCALDAAGNITAWYVHGPDLAFKITADGTLTCYHADAQANVIALSGTNGTLLAQYAFTPYGRILGVTNFQSQISNPYLFVGSQGVMEELPGLYFMRARYYSAEAGVFFSTDPVKNIGPGWKPAAFAYGNGNPVTYLDPAGLFAIFLGGNGSGTATAGAGAEVSGSGGIVIETRALFRGDILNGIGIYQSGAAGASVGIEGGLSGGGEVGVSWDGDYGVESYQGTGGYAGGAGGAGARASLDVSYEPGTFRATGLSLSVGIGPTAGAQGHTGLSKTYVQSLGKIGSSLFAWGAVRGANGPNANSTPMTVGIPAQPNGGNQSLSSRTVTAATVAPAANVVSTKPSGSTSGGGKTSTGGTYTIKPGDTLGNIAYANRTSVAALAALNNISRPNLIYAGNSIRLR